MLYLSSKSKDLVDVSFNLELLMYYQSNPRAVLLNLNKWLIILKSFFNAGEFSMDTNNKIWQYKLNPLHSKHVVFLIHAQFSSNPDWNLTTYLDTAVGIVGVLLFKIVLKAQFRWSIVYFDIQKVLWYL